MNRNFSRVRLAGAALAVGAVGLTACGGQPINKAGSTAPHAQQIVLQMPDGGDPEGLFLAQDITKLSHGTLKVTVDSETYPSQLPANEARLTADLRAGKAGFAYQPARDWAAAGVPGFQALMAPFAVTTVSASERVAASPVAQAVLGQLPGYGAVGVGLVAAEPRQFLTTMPLFSAQQFAGQQIRIIDNPETASLVTALGAHPVQGLASTQVGAKLAGGAVGGVESSPFSIIENAYQNQAPYLSSYAALAKFEILAASKKAWAGLSPADQAVLRQAVADTRAHSSQLASREDLELTQLCGQGVVIDQPSAAQLTALARAAAASAPSGAAVESVAKQIAAIPGTGSQLHASDAPSGCRVATDAPSATAIHQVLSPASVHKGGDKIPAGTYVTMITVADLRAGGQYGADWNKDITWTIVLRADGTVRETQVPDYPDQGPATGRYDVKGDEVTFYLSQVTGWSATETVRWSYFDGQLTFAIVAVADSASRIIYTAHPWRKIS
jgi:TRAP-type C4-dicarboxylate transport system substrate-binding protein